MSRVVLGTDVETGQEVWIDDVARQSGLYMLGKPGMGKSAVAVNIALQDIANDHGICFIDPHGDAILISSAAEIGEISQRPISLISKMIRYSFGINLLKCRNVESLRERTATYTRAYNVFYKLWEDQWGPWLQLILQNVLWAFIENQGYTLAEIPLFLNPRNTAFREHIIDNIKYNDAVADFWRYEFFEATGAGAAGAGGCGIDPTKYASHPPLCPPYRRPAEQPLILRNIVSDTVCRTCSGSRPTLRRILKSLSALC